MQLAFCYRLLSVEVSLYFHIMSLFNANLAGVEIKEVSANRAIDWKIMTCINLKFQSVTLSPPEFVKMKQNG